MEVKLLPLLKGATSFVPGFSSIVCRSTGGTVSARYCYSVWLRHLRMAYDAGLWQGVRSVAELGPGDSFGIGLSALLCGVDRYTALDAKPHATKGVNLAILEELVKMFKNRADIPDESEFPNINPPISNYSFPSEILGNSLEFSLRPARLRLIQNALSGEEGSAEIQIHYRAPWEDRNSISEGSIDMIVSQAVLEHAEYPANIYKQLFRFLRRGGFMSHVIDYKSHGLTKSWNGHWTVPDSLWKLIRGRRPYLINRLGHSDHINSMKEAGFIIKRELLRVDRGLAEGQVAKRFAHLARRDLECPGSFVQAVKTRAPEVR